MSALADRLSAIATSAYDRTRERAGSALPIVFGASLSPLGVDIGGVARINGQAASHSQIVSYLDLEQTDPEVIDVAAIAFEQVTDALEELAGQATRP